MVRVTPAPGKKVRRPPIEAKPLVNSRRAGTIRLAIAGPSCTVRLCCIHQVGTRRPGQLGYAPRLLRSAPSTGRAPRFPRRRGVAP
jgi:hypothetical protein